MIGIYKIQNLVNNKIYIGQSINIDRRFREHCNRCEQQIDHAIQKYGVDNFTFEVIEECLPEQLNDREDYWIKEFNSLIPNGYNMNYYKGSYGEYNASSKLTEEDIRVIRTIYNNREYKSMFKVWQELFEDKISYGNFTAIVRGKLWSHIMPEVFTQENYDYYTDKKRKSWMCDQQGEKNKMSILMEDEVLDMRSMYVYCQRKEIFEKYPHYSERTITAILSGQNWKHLPVYKKREKKWVYPEGENN